jgi:hypothetical protein
MQGPPASGLLKITIKTFYMIYLLGKSTFSRRYFKPYNYEIINRDTLQTAAKCIKVRSLFYLI